MGYTHTFPHACSPVLKNTVTRVIFNASSQGSDSVCVLCLWVNLSQNIVNDKTNTLGNQG